ncbi:MAG: helix-turn-helix domain-containing protein [Faecousia sp.]
MQTIGERIRFIMESNNLKQSGFAEALGVNQSSVSMWLSGKSNPSSQTIQQICDKFGYNPEWLSTGEGEPIRQKSRSDQLAAALGRILHRQDSASARLLSSFALALDELDDDQAASVIDFMTELVKNFHSE